MMPPVRTPRSSAPQPGRSPYETPVCKILIGEEEALFKINEGLLQSTSFFAKHGTPVRPVFQTRTRSPQQPGRHNPESSSIAAGSVFFDDSDRTIESNEDAATIDLTDDDADFVLKGQFYYTRDAFTIFLRSLHDAPPLRPKAQEDCNALFRAYALAQQYDAALLQNQVIDALQGFYAENKIPITDIIYLVEHWGDAVDCFLAAYLVAQTAYEMALDWTTYRQENAEIAQLFRETPLMVEQLFHSILQYAKPSNGQDPAKQKRNWRFQTI